MACRPFAPRYGAEVYGAAFETRTIPSQYSWDSLKRTCAPTHPFIVFQYTLAGWGCFTEGTTVHKMLPEMVFSAVVPSDSRYYLPPESPTWSFSWLIIRHPYIVSRIVKIHDTIGPVFHLPAESMLIARMVQLLEGIFGDTFLDVFAEEQALFDFLIEYERYAFHLRYSQHERDSVLRDVRSFVLQKLARPIEIEELADSFQMSRSRFSHYFKNTTGIAPAQFVIQVRLEEVTERLLNSEMTLEEIASETGFANANHFCKVFRRHFHLSPGEFRRQMRTPGPERLIAAPFAEEIEAL